tara:strand:+ start:418 stop:840 length:423 start_codon:yes stop_codon:yes gene_type:complete
MKTYLITILLIFQFGLSQFIDSKNELDKTYFTLLGNNFLNSEKLLIEQGFSFGTSLSENQSMSYGIFSNNFQYKIKTNFEMTGGVHFLQKSGNNPIPYQNNNFDVLYDLNLKYQPWKNTWIQLSFSNLGPYNFRNTNFKK